ncbi:hypothetical protein BDY24DRAFT_383598 [Mrakia frigida]|uniref:uncharacterized protein n=1 Tax=Mrakia frigida TaxID=29902 RepID=UPI003FCC1187
MDEDDDPSQHRFAHRQANFKSTPSRSAGEGVRRQVQEDQRKKRSTLTTAARLASITSLSSLSLLSGEAPPSSSEEEDTASSKPPHALSGVSEFVGSMEVDTGGPSAAVSTSTADSADAVPLHSKRRNKNKKKKKASPLSNVLMYTTLLPIPQSSPLFIPPDGLPPTSDLTSSWLALGPIPKGKRCLCVAGPYGSATRLHTRISARVILKWVSPLPGETVLDAVLADDWKTSGILYILDILSWRSLDIASNPASFRIPFLHSRLGDLPPPPPLSPPYPYPIHFVPVPYHSAPLPLVKWSQLLGPELGEEERKWGKVGFIVLKEDGAYGFGDEDVSGSGNGPVGEAFEDAAEGGGEVERGWVELGGEVVGVLRRRIEGGEPIEPLATTSSMVDV